MASPQSMQWGVVRVRGGNPQPALHAGDRVILAAELPLGADPDLRRAVTAPDPNRRADQPFDRKTTRGERGYI